MRLLATLVLVPTTLLAAPAQLTAPAGAPHLTHERGVVPGAAGPNALDVDVTLLAGSRAHLADLRVFDQAGGEVQYLIVAPPIPSDDWRAGTVTAIPSTKTESGFELDLRAPLLVDRLRVDGLGAPFLKRYRLEGSGDRVHWVVLADDATLFDLPDEHLAQHDASFPAQTLQYLRVTWDDRSSAVVPRPRAAFARVVTPRGARATPLVADASFERRDAEPRHSRFRVHLPGVGLPVEALLLETGPGHLLRTARVTEGRLSGSTMLPAELGNARLRRAERDGMVASDLRIPISDPVGADLDLVTDDGDNPPLELVAVRVVMRPQPWIYFEAQGTGPLVARYGDEKLSAPRYDLEAMRGALPAAPARATWERESQIATRASASPSTGSSVPAFGALVDVGKFAHFRSLPSGPPGLTALPLDAAVLAASEDLSDLRIVAKDSRQVPYLLERLDEPLALHVVAPARIEPGRDSDGGRNVTRWRIALPEPYLPSPRLLVTTTAKVFTRDASIEVNEPALDARTPPQVVVVARAEWSHADPETDPPELDMELPRLAVHEVTLAIEDGDNGPLPVVSARLLLPSYRLRFFRPATPTDLRLAYGGERRAPRYDLELLSGTLAGAPAFECSLRPEVKTAEGARPMDRAKVAFWAALIAAVIALCLMLARVLREKG